MKRVYVSLPDDVYKILQRDFKNKMGESESEIVRSIVITFLTQRGYFVNEKGYEDVEDVKDRVKVGETLLESLIEVLEEKGDIEFADIDRKVKRKIANQSR